MAKASGDISILSPESIDLMLQPCVNTNISVPENMEYLVSRDKQVGLAWHLGDFRDLKTVGHGGSDVGFNTYFSIMTEESLAVVVLCNADFVQAQQIATFVADSALGFDSTIDQYGKPEKKEPMDLALIILPALGMILIAIFIRFRLKILYVFCFAELAITDTYLIIASLVPLPMTLAYNAFCFFILFGFRKKRLQNK